MPTACDEVQQHWVMVDIEVVHCKTERSTRPIHFELVDNPLEECVHPIQICTTLILLPVLVPFHIINRISTDRHHQIQLPFSIVCTFEMTSLEGHGFTKVWVRCLNLNARLIHINHIACADICPPKWIIPIPEHVPFVEVDWPIRSLTSSGGGLPS
jgi:hypothetical protein